MAKKKQATKPTVAERLVEGLTDLADDLEAGAELTARLTSHRIVLDLKPNPYDGAKAKHARQILGASQAIFAQFLGVSLQTVRAWEQDTNRPSDMACRFMDEICGNPAYWKRRIAALCKPKPAKSSA